MRRFLLLGLLGLTAAGTGCAHRRMAAAHCCGGPLFPNRPRLAVPVGAPAPMGYDAGIGAPVGIGAPGCSSCGSSGVPIASSGGYPTGYQASLHGGQPNYGGGIPHDSVLLPNPTVVPPGGGNLRVDIDPPKTMPMTGGK